MSRAYPNQQTTANRLDALAKQAGLAVHDFLTAQFASVGRDWRALSDAVGVSESSLRRAVRNSARGGL